MGCSGSKYIRQNLQRMLRAAFIIVLIALLPAHVRAEARVALLIGNQVYTPKVGQLKKPHEDVALVGAALKQLRFQVTILKDADYRAMDVAVKRFITEVRSKYFGDGEAPDRQADRRARYFFNPVRKRPIVRQWVASPFQSDNTHP